MSLLYKAQTRFLFHAHIKIKISVFYEDEIFDELFSVLESIDKKYNSYQQGSYIDIINKNAGSFAEVDDETVHILKQIITLSNLFGGEYDITIMPLIRLWGFYKDDVRSIPSSQEIEEVKQLVNYKNIEIAGNKVRIAQGQEIITGSFIKAYAVDKMVERMLAMGITDAIINAGGSTIRTINNEIHPDWEIIVKETTDSNQLFKLKIANCCYSTSSQDKTFVTINNKRYGHILSPATGYPSTTRQIGIVSENCMTGDIISTGLYNLKGEDFVSKMNQLSRLYVVEGFMVDEDGTIWKTNGFEKYITGGRKL